MAVALLAGASDWYLIGLGGIFNGAFLGAIVGAIFGEHQGEGPDAGAWQPMRTIGLCAGIGCCALMRCIIYSR